MFTLLVFMYTLTKRASLQSVLMIAYTLPSVLFSAPAGVYADRHDKRALMIGTNVARARAHPAHPDRAADSRRCAVRRGRSS